MKPDFKYPETAALLISKYLTHHAKSDLKGIAKSIEPSQPVQSAQSDHGRNFSLLADFLCIKW